MSELDRLLDELARGNAEPQALLGVVEQTLTSQPARAVEIRGRLLDARQKNLLSDQDLAKFLLIISRVADSDATLLAFNDEATRINAGAEMEDGTELNLAAERSAFDPGTEADDITRQNTDTQSDDATVINSNTATDDERTMIIADAASGQDPGTGNGDATLINPNTALEDDRTQVIADSTADQTVVLGNGDSDADFDILAEDALAAAEGVQTGATWPTSAEGSSDSAGAARAFMPGDVLKDRFELVSKLGEGGMGAVWKAMDRLKEEARDRNPFVAVKLLQGDFKDHPEAFIALQREASKQQRLAHPNIATVYDFDRDGETVYMTMEAMDGEPMDSFIRNLPAQGLPEEQAMILIRDLCEGLAYAHQAGLVHSDLKPGNAFLVKDPERELGRIKLLDFGIARASSTTSDAEGEKTLFDPGQLGALTPTYATIEMFEGQDPDPRDDIYALAIIAYQLYTGKHPYGKKSAPKAKELGLEPPPIERLDKRQNKGFARGLAFEREARTPSVEDFLDDITRKKSRALLYGVAAALTLLVIAVLAWGPVKEEIQRREREEYVVQIEGGDVAAMRAGLGAVLNVADEEQRSRILADDRVRERVIALISQGDEPSIRDGLELIREPGFEALKESIKDDARAAQMIGAFIARGDEQSIRTGLGLIEPFDPNWQRIVKDQQAVKNAIISFYTSSMYETIDPSQGKYGYAQAAAPLAKLEEIYPDSAEVFQVRRELESHKSNELARLRARYNELLKAGKVLHTPDADDIGDVLTIIAGIDNEQPILTDPKLALRFAELASESMRATDFAKAKEFLLASAEYAQGDPELSRLHAEVDAQLKRQADEQRVADITNRLSGQWQAFDKLANFEAVRDELVELARLEPQNQLLADISTHLQALLGKELKRLRAAKDWQRSEILFRSFAQFLSVPFVTQTRAQLSQLEREAGFARKTTAQDRDAIVTARTRALESLLAAPDLKPRWALEVRSSLNDLIALLPLDDPQLAALRDQIAGFYLASARQAREEQRFAIARDLLAQGRIMQPGLMALGEEDIAITRDEKALQARRKEQLRLARIATLETSLLDKANANEPEAAKKILAQLNKELPSASDFTKHKGPQAIAQAYLRQARIQASRDDFDAAASLVASGLLVAPQLEPLRLAQREYRDQKLKLAQAAQLLAVAGPDTNQALGASTASARRTGSTTVAIASRDYVSPRSAQTSYGATPTLNLAALAPLPSVHRPQILPRYPSLTNEFAEASAQKIVALAQSVSLDLDALEQPLAGFALLYPEQTPTLTDDVVRHVEDRIRELAQRKPLDVPQLAVPLDGHRRLFAERHEALTQEIIATVERRILAYTDAQTLDVSALAEPLTQFASVFPAQSRQLRDSVAERLEGRIAALAQANALDVNKLDAPMRAYRKLYPQRHADLADKVGRTIGARLRGLDVDTTAKLAALGAPLARFKTLFSSAYPGVHQALSEKSAVAIRELLPTDIYAADKLRRAALKALPGDTAIAAIRIELPLQEIVDAKKLLSAGKLTAAMNKLREAISVDAKHSDIPPFEKELQDRSQRAQADYDLYVRYTAERKDRNTRKKLLASATRAWSDNTAFVRVKEPRSGSCIASLAGRGRSKRSTCYDLISSSRKGPIMVVLPAGKFKTPYAIGKYEVTVDDFNRFCKATKSCKPGASRARKLPVTGVSLKQAMAYARWLSEAASSAQGNAVVYRLPTIEEWAYAAAANGEQPEKRSFNCRVTSGGGIIKGHSLLDASTGKENGWGLVNYIGNARELATSGSAVSAMGGAFEDSLTSCDINKTQQHSGEADALTGFRLVREIP